MAAVEGLVANLKEDKGQLERMVAEQKEVIA